MPQRSTIFALSSAPGRAGVAVVRVSGPQAGAVIDALAPPRPQERVAALKCVRAPETGELLDQALVLWFAGPRTETGEDIAEFHLHGGPAIVRGLLAAIESMPGCRLAEPGEFARRAFENGKMDLAEVEGLADLIEAETEAQRRQAVRQMGGALSDLYESWRAELIEACALVEAGIDFSDEADVVQDVLDRASAKVTRLRDAIVAHADDGHRGEILREGFRVVLAGAPNVGKSSLLNALARREAAIVSEEAGTTRDVIEVRLDLEGLPIIVSDTAGIREAEGAVESEGIRRTFEQAREADLVIWLTDATVPETSPPPDLVALGDGLLRVQNKIDLLPERGVPSAAAIAISAKDGTGIDELTRNLAEAAKARIGTSEMPAITRARYRAHLKACVQALDAFLGLPSEQAELRAEDLRQAAQALGRITGRVDVEDVLDQIFGRFCIGK